MTTPTTDIRFAAASAANLMEQTGFCLKSLEQSIEMLERVERDKDSTSQIKAKFNEIIGCVIIPLAIARGSVTLGPF